MNKPVHILIVENKPSDADLAMSEIRSGLSACQFQVVKTRESFIRALEAFQPNVILASLILPRFDGIDVLRLTLQHAPLTPVVIWANSSAEGAVVDCMKAGADNYVNKGNLNRLGPAILEALEENDRRSTRLQADRNYQSIFENSIEGVFRSSPQGHYLSLNKAMARIYGYETPEEMIASVRDIATQIYVEPDSHAEFVRLLHSQKSVQHFEAKNYRKDGSIIWASSSARAERDPTGQVLYYEGFTRDITHRKEVEEELQKNERRFRALIENGLDDISLLAPDGKLIWESPSTIRNLGYAPGEFVGHNIFEIMHPEDLGWTRLAFNDLLHEPGGRRQGTFRLRRSDGTWRWVEAIATNLLNESSINAIVINYRDITERRLAEEALLKSEQRFRALFEDMPAAIWEEDFSQVKKYLDSLRQQGVADFHAYFASHPDATLACAALIKILSVNNTAVRMYEAESREELIETTDNGLCRGETEHIHEVFADIAEGRLGNSWEGKDETLTGRPIEIRMSWSVAPISREDDFRVIVTTLDITQRKQAEEALRQSQNRYRALIETQTEFIVRWKPDGSRTFANEAYCRYFDLTRDQALSSSFFPLIHEEDHASVEEKIHRLLSGKSQVETDIHRVIRPDGSIGWQEWTDQVIRDESGTLLELQSAGRDITERRQVEIERQALLEIMQGLALTNDLQELLRLVHHSIDSVIYAKNFFVVLYQESTGLFQEIYSVDKHDPPAPPSRLEKSITSYVFRTGVPLLLTQAGFDELARLGEVELVGTDSASWLGVPLKTSGKTIGVMAVQDYENNNRYSEHDKEFLASIAAQVALAIERKKAEEALALFRTQIDHINDSIEVIDMETGRFIDVNEHACLIHGYTREEYLMLTIDDIDPLESSRTGEKLLRSGSLVFESMHRRKNGSTFPVEVNLNHIRLDRDYNLAVVRDITERKRAEQALRESEARFSSAFEYASIGMALVALDGHWLRVNRAICELVGYSEQELLEKTFQDMTHPDDLENDLNYVQKVLEGEIDSYQLEKRYFHRLGHVIWVLLSVSLVRDSRGEPLHFISQIQDITERKQAEDELRFEKERFEGIAATVPGIICSFRLRPDGSACMPFASPTIQDVYGFMPTDLQSDITPLLARIHPDDLPQNNATISESARTMQPWHNEFRYQHPTKGEIWIEGQSVPLREGDGSIIWHGFVYDITERKRAEAELRASEERFRQLAENIQEVFWMTDAETNRELYLSPAVETIWGRSIQSMMYEPNAWVNSIFSEDRPALLDAIEREKRGEKMQFEYRIVRPDGTLRWIWDRAFPIFDDSGTVIKIAGISADITDRKEAAERLLESEDRYHRLFQNQLHGSALHEIVTDGQGQPVDYLFLKVNPAFEKMTGLKAEEIIGRRVTEVLPGIETERLIQVYGQVALTGEPAYLNEYFAPLGRFYEINAYAAGPRQFAVSFIDVTERRESAMALEKSQSRYRELFDSSPVSIWEEDFSLVKQRLEDLLQEGETDLKEYLSGHREVVLELASLVKLTAINRASLNLYHASQEEDLIKGLVEALGTESVRHFQEEILGLLSPLRKFVWEGTDRTLDGQDLDVIVTGSIPQGYEDDWSKVIVSITDITQRKQAEQELRKLSRAVEQSGSTIVITDTAGNIEYANPKFTQITGYSYEEVIGKNPRFLKSGFTPAEEYERLWQTITSGQEWHGELLNRKKDGTLFWESVTISPILNDHREITHFVGVTEDVTERKQNEIETRRHIAELEAVYENGLSVGRLLEPGEIGNRLIETFARYLPWHHVTIRLRKEDTDDLELVAFNQPGLREDEKAKVERHFTSLINKVGQGLSGWVIQTGMPLRTGNVHDHQQYVDTHESIRSGLYMPVHVGERVIGVISVESESPDAFTEQDERLLATLANQTAIAFENARLYEAMQKELSERKRVEDALRASETHYRALADSITDLLFEMDQDLHYTHWNKATETLTGIPAHDAIGKSIDEILGINEEQARIKSIYEDVLRSQFPRTFETSLAFSGERRSFEVNAYPSLRGVSVVAKDVTDRKRTETIMQKRFELMDFSAKHSLYELMQRTVDEVSELTGSTIGFFHFMQEDQNNLGMQTWSTNALRLFQLPAEHSGHLPLDQAGVWAEAVRQRRPLIQNDYESLADKKGIPQGHVPVIREMVIPIIRNERIMAVMAIANKPQDYTSRDLEIVTRLADYAWDITERKQMELALQTERNQLVERVEERTADLSRANSNLARALRVKDEFLANMSHELRTPLNAILGLSESLSEQIAGPLNEKQQKYISTISESGHHLLALINDILDLAKIDAGQITMDINKVDIHSVCQASLRMVKQLAQKKNQDVSLEIDPGLGLVWADERRLKQMIVNLLGNAVKFTPENGRLGLEVHGDEEANQIAITVWDNGIGIKEEHLARLFQPFVQLDSGLAREATGTGLGLALVAQMARLHGGGVNVVSEAGQGSRFTIVLPWEPVLAIDTASRMRITGKFRAIEFDETNKPAILLIEDTKEVIMMLRDYLELVGYRVFTAQDGVDGIVQARHVKPDLILMDIQMPRMDGFETTRKLRNDPNFRNTPIIALTALAMPHDRERCLEAGMDEYISKPVNLKVLLNIVQNCLFAQEARTP